MHNTDAEENYLTHTRKTDDRRGIRPWLIASLLKPSGIWGNGLDTLLTPLRSVIREGADSEFPAYQLRESIAARRKSPSFDEGKIDAILETEYSKTETFLALSLLYPFIDFRNQYHIDHVFPEALLKWAALKKLDWPDEEVSWVFSRRNRLPNLQLLDGAENNEKRRMLLGDWLGLRFPKEIEQ